MNLSVEYTKDQIQQYSGSVYFKVFTSIEAAAEKKPQKACFERPLRSSGAC